MPLQPCADEMAQSSAANVDAGNRGLPGCVQSWVQSFVQS